MCVYYNMLLPLHVLLVMYYQHCSTKIAIIIVMWTIVAEPNTIIVNVSVATIQEGGSVTISCTSTGAPVPSISWELNGQPVPFQSVNIRTEGHVSLRRNQNAHGSNSFVPDITLGTTTSNLLIENAQYPDHNGVYACIGSNQENSSRALISIQVTGMVIHMYMTSTTLTLVGSINNC